MRASRAVYKMAAPSEQHNKIQMEYGKRPANGILATTQVPFITCHARYTTTRRSIVCFSFKVMFYHAAFCEILCQWNHDYKR